MWSVCSNGLFSGWWPGEALEHHGRKSPECFHFDGESLSDVLSLPWGWAEGPPVGLKTEQRQLGRLDFLCPVCTFNECTVESVAQREL